MHGHIHSQPSPGERYINVCVEQLDYGTVRLLSLLDAKIDQLAADGR